MSRRREATDTIAAAARGGRATRRQSRTADHTHAPQPPLRARATVGSQSSSRRIDVCVCDRDPFEAAVGHYNTLDCNNNF